MKIGEFMSSKFKLLPYPFIGYGVSSDGKVWSHWMPRRRLTLSNDWVEIGGHFNTKGYKQVTLTVDGAKIRVLVHRLVANAFIGEGLCNNQINHKDCDKSNNSESNLEWVTGSENMQHAIKNGLFPSKKGSLNQASKLNEKQVLEIRERLASGSESKQEIAKYYRVSLPLIQKIGARGLWVHV
jgi:hypothetical protein